MNYSTFLRGTFGYSEKKEEAEEESPLSPELVVHKGMEYFGKKILGYCSLILVNGEAYEMVGFLDE